MNIAQYFQTIREQRPLVHCITNHISIRDCANAILALGARPIMAEHPEEVVEIASTAQSLVWNLGNISDSRMTAILRCIPIAREKQLPVVFDLVGVGCSKLRLHFATSVLSEFTPSILKGNLSEIKMLSDAPAPVSGVDAAPGDQITEETLYQQGKLVCSIAKKWNTCILASGKYDLISDGTQTFAVGCGTPMLGEITGSGCILGALAGVFSTTAPAMSATLCASSTLGVCGEQAAKEQMGLGSFPVALFDALSQVHPQEILEGGKIYEIH